MHRKLFLSLATFLLCSLALFAQASQSVIRNRTQNTTGIEPQPLLAQAIRLKEALSFLGSSLSKEDEKRLTALQHNLLPRKS